MFMRKLPGSRRALNVTRAGAAASAAALAVLAGGTAASAAAAQPTGPVAHPAVTRGVVFTYPNHTQVIVNRTCLLSAKGLIPKHDNESPLSAANLCSPYWVDLWQKRIVGCRSIAPGLTAPVTPSLVRWSMATNGVCPG